MTAYVESPIGRVVNVAWPSAADPGIRLRAFQNPIPQVAWFNNNNGIVRIQVDIEESDFDALNIEVGDTMRCTADGVLVEAVPVVGIDSLVTLGSLSYYPIRGQQAYLPRASWPVPAKPDRFEIRKAGDDSLEMFSDLTVAEWYDYEYIEDNSIDNPTLGVDFLYQHNFTDPDYPYS